MSALLRLSLDMATPGKYYAKKVPSKSPWCPSSSAGGLVHITCLRILRECNHYASHCYILTPTIPDPMDPSRSSAMFTIFLECSGAFAKRGILFHLDLVLPPLATNAHLDLTYLFDHGLPVVVPSF